MAEHEFPSELRDLASQAESLAHRRLIEGKSVDWQRDVDRWLHQLRSVEVRNQIRVIAQLRAFGDATERGLAPLQDAALAQIQAQHAEQDAALALEQAQQAERIAAAAARLSRIGIVVAVVGVVLAAVQVWVAHRDLVLMRRAYTAA